MYIYAWSRDKLKCCMHLASNFGIVHCWNAMEVGSLMHATNGIGLNRTRGLYGTYGCYRFEWKAHFSTYTIPLSAFSQPCSTNTLVRQWMSHSFILKWPCHRPKGHANWLVNQIHTLPVWMRNRYYYFLYSHGSVVHRILNHQAAHV